ncbi:MAG TPA: MarR family transcriptional regulator [Clostridiaceae bacterium]|nr:MarR family transcriptional regulator [Clostridiaceae bacterium]
MEENNRNKEAQAMKLFVVLTRALNAVKKHVEKDIRSHGLNPTEFAVLELIYSKGPHPIQKIGEKVLIASSSITYVVDQLEKKDYLKREPSPKDRRRIFASMTDAGQQLMDEIFPRHRVSMRRIMEGLTDHEMEEVLGLLKKLGFYAEEL